MTAERPKKKNPGGYGTPPAKHRFQPGQSGNPNGRPKGSRNLTTLLVVELNRPVTVTEQGRRRRVRKVAVIARQLANKAAAGDLKAVEMLLRHLSSGQNDASRKEGGAPEPAETDRTILDHALARMAAAREKKEPGDDA